MGEIGRGPGERAVWLSQGTFPHPIGRIGRAARQSRSRQHRRDVRPQGFAMISVDEAVARITRGFAALPSEAVPIGEAAGRVLAEDAVAKLDQPPAPMSAMDGYAVRCVDAHTGAELSVIGDRPAGRPFAREVW